MQYPYQKLFQMERQDIVTIQASMISLRRDSFKVGFVQANLCEIA